MRPSVFIIALLSCLSSKAQININSTTFSYTESFNTLATTGSSNTWTNNSTLLGWYAAYDPDSPTDYITYKAGSGGSSGTALYSFGTGTDSDRALGSLNQNSSGDIAYGVLFQNNSGSTINSATISFNVEQWRRFETNSKGYHRTKLSYQIANDVDVTAAGIVDGDFIDINEGYMLSTDTTTASSTSLDGNANTAHVAIQIPFVLNDGQELFLRLYDENLSYLDNALAMDDLIIDFSPNTLDGISVVSDYDIYAYIDTGIIQNIPHEDDDLPYTSTSGSINNLESIFDDFYNGNYVDARATAASYGYIISSFIDNSKTYYTLRKQSNSTYYWGTYITNSSSTKSCITIQAPHPIKDTNTGSQGAAVFGFSGASNFIVSGISRCASNASSECSGGTTICSGSEDFRISDPAHNNLNPFHIASTILSNINTSMSFVQLHGFNRGGSDPEFIFSNGSETTPIVDNLAGLKTSFQNTFDEEDDSDVEVDVAHLDEVDKLRAFTNVFGRVLNNYPSNICSSSADPVVASGRFLHLEQYYEFRENVSLYDDLATVISDNIDCSVLLPIDFMSFDVEIKRFEAHLKWKVGWEKDVSHYEIQRSEHIENFETIAQVASINAQEQHTYSYVDYEVPRGVNYYRIKQIDEDGGFTFLPTRRVESISNTFIFPNPAENTLFFSGYEVGKEIKIISLEGRILIDHIRLIENQKGVDISSLPKGLFILEIDRMKLKFIKKF